MMKSILSILISLLFLAGSIGIMKSSHCQDCCYDQVCECGVSSVALDIGPVIEPAFCCSSDHKGEIEAESCCHDKGGCCAYELVKLKVPLVLCGQSEKIEIPVKILPKGLSNVTIENQVYRSNSIINKIPDKPPPLNRSGLNLNCIFQC